MPPFIQSLLRPEAHDHPVGRLELLQTHISWVILAGDFAYKIKKPVDFGFVNFVTLESRRELCLEEVRLNRRLAADLYLRVKPVYGPPERASFIGSGEPIDYAVQMRRFPQEDLLPAVLERGQLTGAHWDACADTLAAFHEHAAVATEDVPFGSPETVWRPVAENIKVLESVPAVEGRLRELKQWATAEFDRLKEVFQQRKQAGRVRECHGDLHLGNMLLAVDRIEAFDCLEFNPSLRWTDVICEMAFLAMDLVVRGQPGFAFRVLNRWLEQTGDYVGLATWRWYFCYRATVRAKVAALRSAQPERTPADAAADHEELERYLTLAESVTRWPPRALILTHGVSGSGKSHVAAALCEHLGAIRLRSDVERKRLFGKWGPASEEPRQRMRQEAQASHPRQGFRSEQNLPTLAGDMYDSKVTEKVYQEVLTDLATTVVEAGFPVIVDATFLSHDLRRRFQELSHRLGVPFVILEFEIAPEVARSRIVLRQQAGKDPSDASLAILEQQLASDEPLTDEERERAVVVPQEARDYEKLAQSVREKLAAAPYS